MISITHLRCVFVLTLLAAVGSAAGQTGPALLINPFPDGQRVQVWSQAIVLDDGETDDSTFAPDVDVDLTIYEAEARWLIGDADSGNLRFGAAVTAIDISSPLPSTVLPERFVDQRFALGMDVGEFNGWKLAAAGGIGHAGSNAYNDGDAVYAIGDIVATKPLDETSVVRVFLNYNGNRTFLPDVPLPGIAWSKRHSETLSYTLGVPFSSLTWRPADRWVVLIEFVVPTTVNAKVNYEVVDGLHLFAAFDNRLDAFVLDGDAEHRRYFFTQRRVEGGVTWRPGEAIALEVAGGVAFSQEFKRGFDVRDTTSVVELDDEPYIRFSVNLSF